MNDDESRMLRELHSFVIGDATGKNPGLASVVLRLNEEVLDKDSGLKKRMEIAERALEKHQNKMTWYAGIIVGLGVAWEAFKFLVGLKSGKQ